MTSANHQMSLLSIFPSLKHLRLFFQFMPRTWVDDLEGWTQIAPPSAVDGLTACITHTVAQRLVLTGLLLLLIFLMMNFNGLWPLETAQDGEHWPFSHLSCYDGSAGNMTRTNELTLLWCQKSLFIVKEGFKSMPAHKAWLHSTLIYTTYICYITLRHIKSMP